jgi:hypothetical protein
MTKTTYVKGYDRRVPEKTPDPLQDLIDANRRIRLARLQRENMEEILRNQLERSPRQWWNRVRSVLWGK